MARLDSAAVALVICLSSTSCALFGPNYQPEPGRSLAPLPRPSNAVGPLSLSVVYPPSEGRIARVGEQTTLVALSGYQIQSRDSAFIFGGAGRGDAVVKVNGRPTPVFPSGGWIAWLPLPDDTVARYDIVASAAGDTARLTFYAPIAPRRPEPVGDEWIDTTSFAPTGDHWVRPGESTRLSLRASAGAVVRGILADGREVTFIRDARAASNDATARYVASVSGAVGSEPASLFPMDTVPEAEDSLRMRIELIARGDTGRAFWPLRVGVLEPRSLPVVSLNDDLVNEGDDDGIVVGRPSPLGSYNWFFPNGTVASVSGRSNGRIRLQLSARSSAWVDGTEVEILPVGTPAPSSRVGSLSLRPGEESVVVRIPLQARLPFHVAEDERNLSLTLYGARADVDIINYGGTDPLVRLVSFAQPVEDEVVINVSLSNDVWGYRTHWEGNALLWEIRRPPIIDPKRPLKGLVIALDAGHPPWGATGPAGLWEPQAVLAVSRKAAGLLEGYGATVVLVRDTEAPLGLAERVKRAERANADLMVSVHANALPDGVNPFVSRGTSVYYFHPGSAPLARAVDRALVSQLGFGDLGILRGEFAVLRGTWMPAVLTEGLFMMIPEQESVLASEEGQLRYARGIARGIAAFLREYALRQ